ncbi:hypothetical protein TD95_004649, partial [Thielaviopsis punctulata]
MTGQEDPVNFDILESQKENVQSLPGGHSARKLTQLYSPNPLRPLATPNPADTQDANSEKRAEFEAELALIDESDDPLDVYDRYVRWTLEAYPSAQATPQSQLDVLLERATKTFVSSSQYRNDPRYLKMWIYYIQFFSDAPRETFLFLSRHGIGEALALFYEEFAAWLESQDRWAQAEEVYKLGIEREARPQTRLLRKFSEFEGRMAKQPEEQRQPASPAIPPVRAALAAKIDPFAASMRAPVDPQAARPSAGLGSNSSGGSAGKGKAKSKIAIFSDADAAPPEPVFGRKASEGAKGWDSIGSMAQRKKENSMEPKPWTGETLKAGGKKPTGPKLAVFRDAAHARSQTVVQAHTHRQSALFDQLAQYKISSASDQVVMNPRTGKMERIFVDLEMIYPEPDVPGTELSFEEVWARNRGWLGKEWDEEPSHMDMEMEADEMDIHADDIDVQADETDMQEGEETEIQEDDEVEMTADVVPDTRHEDSVMLEQQRRLQRERERQRQREREGGRERERERERELELEMEMEQQQHQVKSQQRLILSPRPKLAIHRDSPSEAIGPAVKAKIVVHKDLPSPVAGSRVAKMHIHCDAVVPQKQKLAIHHDDGSVLSKKQKLSVHHDGFGDENAMHGLANGPHGVAANGSARRPTQMQMAMHGDGRVNVDENGQVIQEQPRAQKNTVVDYNETQIIKAKLDSPSRPKIAKRKSMAAEPTMTIHTKAATDDIYDIFNAPLPQKKAASVGTTDDDEDYDSDEYMTDAESTMTTKNVDLDEVEEVEDVEEDDDDAKSDWSEFTTRKADDMTSKTNPDFTVRGVIEEGGGDTSEEDDDGSDVDSVEEVESSLTPTGSQQPPSQDATQEIPPPPPQKYTITHTKFIPVPPEDYVAPTRPYRDPAEVANNRLPFMTPITERTEMSLDFQQMQGKTPSRIRSGGGMDTMLEEDEDNEPLSSIGPSELLTSPLAILTKSPLAYNTKISQPAFPRPRSYNDMARGSPDKGPVITEVKVNPMASDVRQQILATIRPPLGVFSGFYDHSTENYEKGNEIRRFARAMSKAKASGDAHISPVIRLPDSRGMYTVRKELGAGAFAPVYLVENSAPGAAAEDEDEADVLFGAVMPPARQRAALEALKMETPPSTWEFYMMRLAHRRLGPHNRATASLSYAHELHLYRDEGFLVLPFHAHGTLLDVVNLFRAEPSGVMDEQLAMFFSIELLRTVEALHAKGIMHGDLKADNCLLRIDVGGGAHGEAATLGNYGAAGESVPLTAPYQVDGSGGWAARGVTLIDFGRGIDMRAFAADTVQFFADWKTTAQDCAEMREGRPWTWHIDYHGLAGIVHTLLFGKYIETVRAEQGVGGALNVSGAAGRRYRVRENMKRYWQTDIWVECFDLLLNPGQFVEEDGEAGGRLPVTKGLRRVREKMEKWLVVNGERGTGLRTLMNKVEAFAKGRR